MDNNITHARNAVRRAVYFLDTCGTSQRPAAQAMVDRRKRELAELLKKADK
tara:strand:- start:735 stop:887 length:153 start_codon:yes stop_codon:yes gene_type:complete